MKTDNIQIRHYKDGDYESIQECVEPFVKSGNFDIIRDCGVYLTITNNDIPVGCGGVIFTEIDEGEMWLRLSPELCRMPVLLMYALDAGYNIIVDSMEIKRLTARVNTNFSKGQRLSERFKFQPTNEVLQIGDQTYRIYEQWLTR